MERFERFQFSVPAVPLGKVFCCLSALCNREGRLRLQFRFLEIVPAVPVPLSVPQGSRGVSKNFGPGFAQSIRA